MLRHPDDYAAPPLLFGLSHQAVDAGDVGTGGVLYLRAALLQMAVDRSRLSVGADEDHRSLRDSLGTVGHLQTQVAQPGDHLVVMDEVAQHHAAAALTGKLFGHLNSPLHAVAEPRVLGKRHLHACSPSA